MFANLLLKFESLENPLDLLSTYFPLHQQGQIYLNKITLSVIVFRTSEEAANHQIPRIKSIHFLLYFQYLGSWLENALKFFLLRTFNLESFRY